MSSIPNISINARRLDGQEFVVRVPIRQLELEDSTIHKFAARAFLGDLERGESRIQRPGGALRDSAQVQQMTVNEGERLGCKWSLISKWTSFVAVETVDSDPEPEQVVPAVQSIQMLDAENSIIERVDGDSLGLLRPRGRRIRRDEEARLSGPTETDQFDGHPSQERIMNMSSGSSNSSSDESEGEMDTRDDMPRNDVNDDDDDHGGGPCIGFGHTSGSSYDFGSGSAPPRESNHGSDTSYNANSGESRQYSVTITSVDGTSTTSLPTASHGAWASSRRTAHHFRPKEVSRLSQDASRNVAASSSSTSAPADDWKTWDEKKKMAQLAFERQLAQQPPLQMNELGRHSTQQPLEQVDMTSQTSCYTMAADASPNLLASSNDTKSSTTIIRAPGYNPPSSSALLTVQSPANKPEKLKNAEAYVLRLIKFQQSDGCFQFPTGIDVGEILGSSVFNAISRLTFQENLSFRVAVTIAVVGLLEVRLQQCADLWSRAADKARHFLWSRGFEDVLSRRAAKLASGIKELPFEDQKEGPVVDERVLLETAPYV
jgi:hypothetical protein